MPRRPAGSTTSVIQLRIALREVEPPIWRQIQVPGRFTLIQLAEALLVTMGWLGYHLYEYRIQGEAYGDPDPDFDYGRKIKDLRRVRLERVVRDVGEQFQFLYDFGDGWIHDVTVEAIVRAQPRTTYPRIIAGERACPPEDVGGPHGYTDFRAAIGDPSNEAHDQLLDWVGREFDPDWFDLGAVNEYFEFGS